MNLRGTKIKLCACAFLSLFTAFYFFPWMISLLSHKRLKLRLLEISSEFEETIVKNYEEIRTEIITNNSTRPQLQNQRLDKKASKNSPKVSQTRQENKRTSAAADSPKTLYPLTLHSPLLLNSPQVCRGVDPLHVMIVVHTATSNFQRRSILRDTWASKDLIKTHVQRVVFLVGMTQNATIQQMIEDEYWTYGDLVQGQFMDTYHNLTHKGVMGLRWVHEYCSHAQLILKVDDDVFFNPFLFYNHFFAKLQQNNRSIACQMRRLGTSVIQRRKGKWKVPEFQFRGFKTFPVSHCNGFVMIITPDIIRSLYMAAHITPFFWLDDVYLSGILASKVGNITHVDMSKNLTQNVNLGVRCYRTLSQAKPCPIVASIVNGESTFYELWHLILARIPSSFTSDVNSAYVV